MSKALPVGEVLPSPGLPGVRPGRAQQAGSGHPSSLVLPLGTATVASSLLFPFETADLVRVSLPSFGSSQGPLCHLPHQHQGLGGLACPELSEVGAALSPGPRRARPGWDLGTATRGCGWSPPRTACEGGVTSSGLGLGRLVWAGGRRVTPLTPPSACYPRPEAPRACVRTLRGTSIGGAGRAHGGWGRPGAGPGVLEKRQEGPGFAAFSGGGWR